MIEWLLIGNLVFSFSIRQASEQPNPFDYEFLTGYEIADSLKIFNRFERDDGTEYRDQEYMIAKSFRIPYIKPRLVIRERYLEANSRNQLYNQFDVLVKKNNYMVGLSIKASDNVLSRHMMVAYSMERSIKNPILSMFIENTFRIKLELSTAIYDPMPVDVWLKKGLDYSITLKRTMKISAITSVYGLIISDRIRGAEYYQAKIGIETKIPKFVADLINQNRR